MFATPELILAQTNPADTIQNTKVTIDNGEQFYDSLKYKAGRSRLARLMYDFLITPPRPYVDQRAMAFEYYSQYEGKLITEIEIKALDVFGPSFSDTAKTAHGWLERTANTVHTKSNLKTIRKSLLFKAGDSVDPELLYENERIIRSLPYIKDVRFLIDQDTIYSGLVKIIVLTKDRFSFGVAGALDGVQSGELEIYNQNIFGVGHEISFRFVGHLSKQPFLGLETYYKINNIRGKFLDITTGYLNHYKREGFVFDLRKPFITPSVKWGYGATAIRFYRTDLIFESDPVVSAYPLDLAYLSAWGGRSFSIREKKQENTQMVISGAFYHRQYYDRPKADQEENQFYSNSTFYLAGLTFAQRRYLQDQLVYSYGITEDIPEGFRNEFVYGFDANEFGNRHYAHLSISNGNRISKDKGYIFTSAGIGGYFNALKYEQGQINGSLSYISKQINAGKKRFRFFAQTRYTMGLRRFEIENLGFQRNNHIRGYASAEAVGKQRLSLNLEYVLFLRKEFYRFNMALFGFTDVGIIGSNKELIFTQNYYSGIGAGLRLHNENLVFKTFFLRLAFYPFPPGDMSTIGFLLSEQSKKRFQSFEPIAPQPFRFE